MEGRDKRGDDGGGAAVCGEDSVSVCVSENETSVFSSWECIHSFIGTLLSIARPSSLQTRTVCLSVHPS